MWNCTNWEFLSTVCPVEDEFLNQTTLKEKYTWKILKYRFWTENQWCDKDDAYLAITMTVKWLNQVVLNIHVMLKVDYST